MNTEVHILNSKETKTHMSEGILIIYIEAAIHFTMLGIMWANAIYE